MKKILFGITLILLTACSNIKTPKNNVIKESNFISASVPETNGNIISLELENKTDKMVEVLLSDSTINNKPIYDGEEIERVSWQNVSAAFAGAANGLNYANTAAYGAYPQQHLDDVAEQLTKKSADIVLAPKEKLKKQVGNSVDIIPYPIKVVLKVKQGEITDYSYINLELEEKE